MQLIALVVTLGMIVIGALSFQQSTFDRTTSRLDAEVQMTVDLRSATLNVSVAAIPVMYAFGRLAQAEEDFALYELSFAGMLDRIAEARTVMSGDGTGALLDDLEKAYRAADVGIREAPAVLASGAVVEALAKGQDPFAASVWAHLEPVDVLLSDLAESSVKVLRDGVADANDMKRNIRITVAVALLGALLVFWRAGHRMRRRVVEPIVRLRAGAMQLRDSQLERPVELEGAAAELNDLADTLNETATWLRASHTKLREQADTDSLTGLPNRKSFITTLHARLDDHTVERPDHVAVLFIDLDDFKVVNDTFGHAGGDELLRIVARRLRGIVRADEVVARLGGDEFAMVLGCKDRSDAIAVAQRTLAAFAESFTIEATSVDVACSIGIAVGQSGDGAAAGDELIRNADFAMYMAKGQGKNCFDVFAPSMYTEMVSHMELKHDLDDAVTLGQYVLHYQPVLDLNTRRLIGFEALVRWQHPTRGLLAPAEFIGLAEDTGAIVRIGAWVLDQACAELARRRDAQLPDEVPLWMSINVAAQQIATDEFASTVVAALERHGVPADSLILEVTEETVMTSTAAASMVLAELRQLGVHVALDDFGTGFLALGHIDELPVDVIKIDRAFIGDSHPSARMLLTAIVEFGRTLGLQIIAEGIEHPDDLARLDDLGQLSGQGYLFARPLTADDAAAYQASGSEHGSLTATG